MTLSIMDKVKAAKAVVPEITAEEALKLHGQEGVVFIDVRDAPEIAKTGKVSGAWNVSRGVLEFKADHNSPMYNDDFDDAKKIILYCATGARAALSGLALKELGYDDVVSMNSISFWLDADGPVDT